MTLKEQMQLDLDDIEQDLEYQSFTWQGVDIICIASSLGETKDLEGGGFEVGADLIFTVNLNKFTDGIYPLSKQYLTYRSKQYRIESVTTNTNQSFLRLFCVDRNKGV